MAAKTILIIENSNELACKVGFFLGGEGRYLP
jgi:hypothetical protein